MTGLEIENRIEMVVHQFDKSLDTNPDTSADKISEILSLASGTLGARHWATVKMLDIENQLLVGQGSTGMRKLDRNNGLISTFCNESWVPYSYFVSSFRNIPAVMAHDLADVPAVVLARSLLCRSRLVGESDIVNATDAAVFQAHGVPVAASDAAEYLRQQGNASFKKRRYSEAVHFYRAAAMVSPLDGKIHTNLATSLRKMSRVEEAVTAARHSCRLAPEWAKGWYILALGLNDMQSTEEAMDAARRAGELAPDDLQMAELVDKLSIII